MLIPHRPVLALDVDGVVRVSGPAKVRDYLRENVIADGPVRVLTPREN
ncbi:hypothetical protein [Xylanimonas ulmi]|uniref:Uncharacterized protein n=1 Tax=Xylanimonas ulmi TaxID=228973 RepID=A0A4Q7M3X9_9MICO|nr:hypothetical protein [Xylanibacterium ulmi]RZS61208.1 hypothetical protein EV386_1499 [Xylanibacterium ulmi]